MAPMNEENPPAAVSRSPILTESVRPQHAYKFMTPAMHKIFGVMICLFAIIRLVSHPAAQNRVIDYVLMAVMFACGIFLLLTKKTKTSDKK
jgi:hypothetical protein